MAIAHLGAALVCTEVLDCNKSDSTSVAVLCQLLATHINTCDWPTTICPGISALTSCNRLPLYQCTCIMPGPDDIPKLVGLTHQCHASLRGLVSCQCGLVRPRPTLTVRFLYISPNQLAPPCCLHMLVFTELQPDQSSSPRFGKPPIAPQIFPSLH